MPADLALASDQYIVPDDPQWPQQMNRLAMTYLEKYASCTQGILWAFMQEMRMENRMVLRASGAMQGGMLSSLTCGVHTAGLMVLGVLLGREKMESGLDGIIPIVMPAQHLIKTLTNHIGGHSCLEMTGVDFTDLEAAVAFSQSHRHNECVTRVGKGAQVIAKFLQDLDAKGELFRLNSGV